MPEISILLVGDTDRSEFRDARAALDASGQVAGFRDAASAAAALAQGQLVPDVIVVAQTYPAQFSQKAVDRLRRLAPLARVLGLMGSWCEGEMRTGQPWPATVRVYWHQWLPRCAREFGHMQRGECSAWGLPITATDEERLLLAADRPAADRQGLIAIHTRSFEMDDWLSAACRSRGWSTVWLRPPQPARVEGTSAAVFDGSDCRGRELRELRDLCGTLRPPRRPDHVPILAMLDFPRIEDRHRALAAGAAAVVSKPLQVGDLFWELDRMLGYGATQAGPTGPS